MIKKPEIAVCTNLRPSGASCASQGAASVLKALRQEDAVKNGDVIVSKSVCLGYCGDGPNVKIIGGAMHHGVAPAACGALVAEALQNAPGEDPGNGSSDH